MDRESFLFYRSYRKAAHRLPEKARLDFYEKLFDYGLDGVEPDDTGDPLTDMALDLIRPLIAANLKNYINGCKGGAPSETMKGNQNAKKTTQNKPKTNRKQTQNKGNVNDKDNEKEKDKEKDKDNANDNVKEKEKEKEKERPLTFFEWIASNEATFESVADRDRAYYKYVAQFDDD